MVKSKLTRAIARTLTAPITALIFINTMAVPALADCSCLCVEGAVQAVCVNSIEPRPLCAPASCAPAPEIRAPKPQVSSPGKEWKYATQPGTKIGYDGYDWVEVGEEVE